MNRNIRNRFLAALLEQINSHSLFCPDDRWLLAVSGGPDSMAMLYGILALQRETEWPGPEYLHVAHLNHLLRGAESDADAEFVRTETKKLGLDCTISATNVDNIAQEIGESLETTARTERYKFLSQTAVQNHCNKIVLAHNADDQAETILHRILRGTGVRGLAGIPATRKLEEYGPADPATPKRSSLCHSASRRRVAAARKPLIVIRPLLTIPKQDIEDFLKTENIPYRIDQSNFSQTHTRNRLRHELLPLLQEKFNPQVNQALTQLGQTAEWMSELLNEDAKAALSELTVSRTDNAIVLDLPGVRSKTIIQQTELIHQAMRELPVGLRPIGFTHIHAILESIAAADLSPQTIDLPNQLKITRNGKQLIFKIQSPMDLECPVRIPTKISLPIHQEVDVKQPILGFLENRAHEIHRIRTEPITGGPEIFAEFRQQKTAEQEMIDLASVQGSLRLRTWREGDRFTPLGAEGKKTLGDFFTDAKVPVEYRKRIGLVCDDAGIVWVVGLRIADRVKITPSTRQILKITVE